MFQEELVLRDAAWVVHTGLIILDARYGPSERDEGTEGLDVDVTIPVQALVNSSQLYVPGKRSKVRRSFAAPSLCALRLPYLPDKDVVVCEWQKPGPGAFLSRLRPRRWVAAPVAPYAVEQIDGCPLGYSR